MASEPPIAATPAPDLDLSFVDQVVGRLGGGEEQAIPILQALQVHYRYLPDAVLRRVCDLTDIRPATLAGVSTFYAQFRHRPMGRHHVKVCNGTACHIHGAEDIHESLCKHLHLAEGEDTDKDGVFTVERFSAWGVAPWPRWCRSMKAVSAI